MILSLAFAFIILVLTSFNIILSIYSVLAIGGVLSSVTAIIHLIGWQLGTSESIALVVFVGLSVDYIAHMSHFYIDSVHDTRELRMNHSF